MPVHAMTREFEEETGVRIPVGQWQPFANISGNDDNTDGAPPGDYEVVCYRAVSSAINGVVTREDEKVLVVSLESIQCGAWPVMHNIRWLVPMAALGGMRATVKE